MPHLPIIKTNPTSLHSSFLPIAFLSLPSLSLSLSATPFIKAMKDEWWLKAAISDDTVVADLLLRLKDSITDDPSSSSVVFKTLPPSWGVRQPRSSVEKKKDTPRRSPTTPLSFGCAGGASPSEGYEDSSGNQNHLHRRHQDVAGGGASHSSDRFRSKGFAETDQTLATTSKRSRRKKTFGELKEEETSLMKERDYLNKELATLRLTLKEQRSINDNLKRIKIDLGVQSRVKPESNSTEQEERNSNHNGESEAGSSNVSMQIKAEDGDSSQDPIFVLPDLNMDPEDEAMVPL